MKCKVFSIRLRENYAERDAEKLNTFLQDVTVRHIRTSIIDEPDAFWSVLIFYEEGGADLGFSEYEEEEPAETAAF